MLILPRIWPLMVATTNTTPQLGPEAAHLLRVLPFRASSGETKPLIFERPFCQRPPSETVHPPPTAATNESPRERERLRAARFLPRHRTRLRWPRSSLTAETTDGPVHQPSGFAPKQIQEDDGSRPQREISLQLTKALELGR